MVSMKSIFSSGRAITALAALESRPEGARLTELSALIKAPVSSVQAALDVLIADRLVSTSHDRQTRYFLALDQRGDAAKLLDVASKRDADGTLTAAALRANPAVEFSARDRVGLLIVTRWDTKPSDEVLLERSLSRTTAEVTRIGHDDLRELLYEDDSLRDRAHAAEVISGRVDRSFPRPFAHGAPDAPALGRLNPAINPPSRRALTRLAQRFGLAEIRVFGSAVHSDFRPDSDVDLAVTRRPGARRTLDDEFSLRRELEDLFGRDVDVVDLGLLRPLILDRARSEGVVLYG
jgi:predicted nucleotidyltransferase/DNA-binding MarR family transcriptional regulator